MNHNWQAGHEPDEIEALREKVAALTKKLDSANNGLISYAEDIVAMTQERDDLETIVLDLQMAVQKLTTAQARIKELREMVEKLREAATDHCTMGLGYHWNLHDEAADLIERLAARVPNDTSC